MRLITGRLRDNKDRILFLMQHYKEVSDMKSLNNKRIRVTGGGGFLGSHLCEKLLNMGRPNKSDHLLLYKIWKLHND